MRVEDFPKQWWHWDRLTIKQKAEAYVATVELAKQKKKEGRYIGYSYWHDNYHLTQGALESFEKVHLALKRFPQLADLGQAPHTSVRWIGHPHFPDDGADKYIESVKAERPIPGWKLRLMIPGMKPNAKDRERAVKGLDMPSYNDLQKQNKCLRSIVGAALIWRHAGDQERDDAVSNLIEAIDLNEEFISANITRA